MVVIHISNMDEYQNYVNNNENVILYCSASWCGPCKKVSPIFEKLSNLYSKTKFLKCDVGKSTDIANELKVNSIPLFVFTKNGDIIDALLRADISTLLSFCNNYFV